MAKKTTRPTRLLKQARKAAGTGRSPARGRRTPEAAPVAPAPVDAAPVDAAPADAHAADNGATSLPPVVGIGMSAGGLEACSQLLEALPSEPGLVFVLIQHLSPHHRSALPTLLSARARLRVVEASDDMEVVANCVYVIPPDYLLELVDGHLRLVPRREGEPHVLPVDYFLSSLATVEGDRAIAVILSGTGSDGTAGVLAIKHHGGTVLVQQPDTAKYDGMPRAAIEAGAADLVLPPADIASKLVELARFAGTTTDALGQPAFTDRHFEEIFNLLRATIGVDFSHYKQPTIRRRILRRMAINRATDVDRYVALLRQQPEETRSLYQDILIHVTRFFREPESFQALAASVFPKVLEGRRSDNPVRIWVAGCATGEEAYSLAISLVEYAGDDLRERQVQIFGTDISETAIEYARQGTYPASIVEVIPPDRLRRFFTKVDSGYRITKSVRDLCVFARQDLTRDPPFSKLDMILCRNVLIYMDGTLQRRVIPIFHYALRPEGFLVLGQAETVGTAAELFSLVDKRHKIYRKRPAEYLVSAGIPISSYPISRAALPQHPGRVDSSSEVRAVQNEANRVLLDRYSPCGVLVNEDLEIVQFRGHTGAYLEPAPGDASLSLLKLAREGLLHGLRSALQGARKARKPVRKEGLRVRSEAGWAEVDLDVIPLTGVSTLHFLVLFDRARPGALPDARARKGQRRAPSAAEGTRTAKLEEELAATREYLQSIIQEVEAANEELQSANEEILSSNEELQSTNEELDTAKEELQSTNEELNTLNDEMHARNEELTRVNSDLINLLGSVQVAIVIVDTDLRVRRFTPVAEKVLNLIPADIGRPITQVKPNIDCPDLGVLIGEVVDRVTTMERDVYDAEGHWYSLRIRPYKGAENRIDGAVVAVFDIDPAKRQEQALASARQYAESVAQAVPHPLMVLDEDQQVRLMNRAFCSAFRVPATDGRPRRLKELGGPWASDPVSRLLDGVFHDGDSLEELRVEVELPDAGRRVYLLSARAVPGMEQNGKLLVVAAEDVTEREVQARPEN